MKPNQINPIAPPAQIKTRPRSNSFYIDSPIAAQAKVQTAAPVVTKKLSKIDEFFLNIARRIDRFFSKFTKMPSPTQAAITSTPVISITSQDEEDKTALITQAKEMVYAMLHRNKLEEELVAKIKPEDAMMRQVQGEVLAALQAEYKGKLSLAMANLCMNQACAIKQAQAILSEWTVSNKFLNAKEINEPREMDEILILNSRTQQKFLREHLLNVLKVLKEIQGLKLALTQTTESPLARHMHGALDQWSNWISRITNPTGLASDHVDPSLQALLECTKLLGVRSGVTSFAQMLKNIDELYVKKNRELNLLKAPLPPRAPVRKIASEKGVCISILKGFNHNAFLEKTLATVLNTEIPEELPLVKECEQACVVDQKHKFIPVTQINLKTKMRELRANQVSKKVVEYLMTFSPHEDVTFLNKIKLRILPVKGVTSIAQNYAEIDFGKFDLHTKQDEVAAYNKIRDTLFLLEEMGCRKLDLRTLPQDIKFKYLTSSQAISLEQLIIHLIVNEKLESIEVIMSDTAEQAQFARQ